MPDNSLSKVLDLLDRLEKNRIFYELHKYSHRMLMVSISVPGERWEVEFGEEGEMAVERFVSVEGVGGHERLTELFTRFSEPDDCE